MSFDADRTASLLTPARLAELRVKPKPATPAAYLDRLAADAGSVHVLRLVELRKQLDTHLSDGGYAHLTAALQSLDDALGGIDLSLMAPKGWLARATGKEKTAVSAFAGQYDRAAQTAEDVKDEIRAVQKRQQGQASACARTLTEFEVEVAGIENAIDQGARWLQDMRNQLKERQAGASDERALQQIREDTARCELLVERLKKLRAASNAAQQARQHARALIERRATLIQSVQKVIDTEFRAWQKPVAELAELARDGAAATGGLEAAQGLQAELRKAAREARGNCEHVQKQDAALTAELASLGEPLQAAA